MNIKKDFIDDDYIRLNFQFGRKEDEQFMNVAKILQNILSTIEDECCERKIETNDLIIEDLDFLYDMVDILECFARNNCSVVQYQN